MWKEEVKTNIIEVLIFLPVPSGPSCSPCLCSRLPGGHCLVLCLVVRLELRASTSYSVTLLQLSVSSLSRVPNFCPQPWSEELAPLKSLIKPFYSWICCPTPDWNPAGGKNEKQMYMNVLVCVCLVICVLYVCACVRVYMHGYACVCVWGKGVSPTLTNWGLMPQKPLAELECWVLRKYQQQTSCLTLRQKQKSVFPTGNFLPVNRCL